MKTITDEVKLKAAEAAEILLACRATLAMLENSGKGRTLAADQMGYAIELLQAAGADMSQLTDLTEKEDLEAEQENNQVENETVYVPDPEELAELKQRIAASDGKPGIPHEEIKQKLRERIANRNLKPEQVRL